jgi:hypothetical protein
VSAANDLTGGGSARKCANMFFADGAPRPTGLRPAPLPTRGRAIAYGIFQQVVPAKAGTHTARTLASALEQRSFFHF